MKRTILRLIIASILVVAINWIILLIGACPLSFSFFYVFPIAGMIYGLIIGGLTKKGIIKDRIPFSKKGIVCIALYSAFMIFALTFLEYKSCYVSDDLDVNYSFQGNHISEYYFDDVEMTFGGYFKMNYLDSKQSSSMGSDKESIIPTAIVYFANYIVAFLSCFIILDEIGDIPMCKACRRYYKTEEIDRFVYGLEEQQVVDMILSQLETGMPYEPKNPKISNYSFRAEVSYCTDCKKGRLIVYRRTIKGNKVEDVVAFSRDLYPQYVKQFLGERE